MHSHVMKSKENKNKIVQNSVAQNRNRIKQYLNFSDNRPESAKQKILQKIATIHPPAQTIQLRLWDNKVGLFSTLNNDPLWSFLGNSVYDVTAHGMRRYAPINWYREPTQVSHNYPNRHMSFMTETTMNRFLDRVDEGATITAEVEGNRATITSDKDGEKNFHLAELDSSSGLGVVDFTYDDGTKKVGADYHPGHNAIPAASNATTDVPAIRPPLPRAPETGPDPYAPYRLRRRHSF